MSPSHADFGTANGDDAAGSVEGGSGASEREMIVASGRVGSFSPAGPVSTAEVIKVACVPAGGVRYTKLIRPPGGTSMCPCQSVRLGMAPFFVIGTPSSET